VDYGSNVCRLPSFMTFTRQTSNFPRRTFVLRHGWLL